MAKLGHLPKRDRGRLHKMMIASASAEIQIMHLQITTVSACSMKLNVK
jgi:hypothetical protein